MQKKLADYMRTLVEKMRDVLADYYGTLYYSFQNGGKIQNSILDRENLIEPSCPVRRCNRASQVGRGLYGRRPDRQSQRR